METSLTVRNMRRQSWGLMLREQASSGLSVREWCKQNNISVKSFYYRRNKVQEMMLDSGEGPRFAELIKPIPVIDDALTGPASGSSFGFVPQLTISAGDMVIGVSCNTPKQLLSDVLRVINNA